MSSIDLFGGEVLPAIKERDHQRTKEKALLVERLSEKAMKRKTRPAPAPAPTVIRAAGHH